MAEVVIAEFEVAGLSASALAILKTAVMYARSHSDSRMHNMPIAVFCLLAGLPRLAFVDFRNFLSEARKAVAYIEIVDTDFPYRDDLPSLSWPVFSEARLAGSNVLFEVCPQSWDDRMLKRLALL